MNVFVIPSWFPSETNPHYGIFIKEQLGLLAMEKPDWQIGVSTWGQGDIKKLLWGRDHVFNLRKVYHHSFDEATETNVLPNLTEYYQPALAWTKKFRKGNLAAIIQANEKNLRKFIEQYGRPDILWIQAMYPGALIGRDLSEKYNLPYIVHVRFGGYMFENLIRDVGHMRNDLLKSVNAAKQVTMTSGPHLTELKNWIPTARVIHNPVDIKFFSIEEKQKEFMLAIGRLEEEKGFDLLINAMKDIDYDLVIAGHGSQLKKLKKSVASSGLESSVSFVGVLNRDEVREKIRNCSFLVLPSRYESFGNVLLEAMACGKPVVACRCGGPEEIVTPNSGYLCEPESADLAEKINAIIKNRATFDSDSIRSEVEARFSPGIWAKKIEEIFKAALSN